MGSRFAVLVFAVAVAAPAPAHAWGYEAHWHIMDRAIALLPPELRPFFEANRTLVVQHVIDPDTWRNGGNDAESPNHFLDLDWSGYGKDPYAELPRDLTAAIAKFGRDRIESNGLVPWRCEEMHGNLRRAFEDYGRRGPFGRYDIIFYAAWLAHYVSDAHVPLHAVFNHDGQLTGQTGLHSRWEVSLFERYRDSYTVAATPRAPILAPRDYIFDVLLQGTRLVPALLASDRAAIGDRDEYDDQYYAAFYRDNREVLQRRLNESMAGVAAVIAGAWEAAGKPPVPVTVAAAPQRRRRP